MSFYTKATGNTAAPGFFLASETCTRVTREIPQSLATTVGDSKYVKAGTIFPANGATAIGIVYEDVDVTSGNMPGSIVTAGEVYKDRLPVEPASAAETAMKNIRFTTAPTVTRPEE